MHNRKRLENITIVLKGPKYPGNIGSVARCAKNMGIEKIIVVGGVEYDREEINRMSTHLAADVVEKFEYYDDLKKALAPFRYIIGTTARRGNTNLKREIMDPREMAKEIAGISEKNEVGLLFGPEDRGLTNGELKYCDMLVSIPTSESMRSINLSHAVMIISYEIFKACHESNSRFTPKLATSAEKEGMYDHIKELLLKINYIYPENPEYAMTSIRNLFSRLNLTAKDVKIVRGVCRQIDLYGRGKTKNLTLHI
ncbi:MAG: RNA methyltransferase [Thermodesulfobacteriota bacterium]|nr:RNA methyltransferase [Thermodesulfobacteriota bacterium]